MKALLLILFFVSSYSLWCATLIVDNNIPSTSQYTTLQAAHDAASNGDIIQVMPSNGAYSGITITKRIEIIGVGWNPEGQDTYTIKRTNILDLFTFSTGSAGSRLIGFGGVFYLLIQQDNITVKNCNLSFVVIGSNNTTAYNTLLINNLIYSVYCPPLRLYCNNGYNSSVSLQMYNCMVIYAGAFIWNEYNQNYGVYLSSNYVFINNTILYAYEGMGSFTWDDRGDYTNATLMNNIVTANLVSSPNFTYNVTGNSAIYCISSDYYTLPGSAAIDAGNPNIAFNDLDVSRNDCGAYGGPTPFVDGGIPGYPSIYEINGPGVAHPMKVFQFKSKPRRTGIRRR